jgi:hypothetical protein
MLRILFRDRRIWLTALVAVLTLVVSRFTLGSSAAVKAVVDGGYWVLLLVFGFFIWRVSRLVRTRWAGWRTKTNAAVLALVLGSGVVLLVHERYGFKILADELLLSGTSMGMHYQRQAAYPVRATDVQGPFQILQTVIDKRPIFFPFLVSLVHDLTGYRPENAFYLNTVLGCLFLGLVFALGSRIGRSPWAGVFGVLLFAGLPLLSQQMKGGGFELLNLIMLSAVLLLGIEYAEQREEHSLEALTAAAVLLAYTRYESIVMLVPVAALIVWGWLRAGRVILTWPVVLSPALLLLPLLQNRVFSLNATAWELGSKPGATSPFGLQYLRENLGHAAAFFFDVSGYQPNSPFFGAVGVLAVVFFVLWIVRILRQNSPPAEIATAVLGLGFLTIGGLLMLYFWGQFDHPVIHRLSLPVHLLMVVAIAAVGSSLWRSARVWQFACAAALVAWAVYSVPTMSRRAYGATYSPAAEMEWRTEFLHRYPAKDYLFLDNDSVFWITHHVASTPNTLAKEKEEGLVYHLRNDSFSAIYVMQHFRIDPKTGAWKLEPTDDLGPDFELEPFWERRIQTLFIGRISRVRAIHQGGTAVTSAGFVTPAAGRTPPKSADDSEKARKDYIDKWLKDLP